MWVNELLKRDKRVCIDLSCWIVQLQNVNKSHCSIKDKVYLRGLFHRLRALLALNCTLIMVAGNAISTPFYPFLLLIFKDLGFLMFRCLCFKIANLYVLLVNLNRKFNAEL